MISLRNLNNEYTETLHDLFLNYFINEDYWSFVAHNSTLNMDEMYKLFSQNPLTATYRTINDITEQKLETSPDSVMLTYVFSKEQPTRVGYLPLKNNLQDTYNQLTLVEKQDVLMLLTQSTSPNALSSNFEYFKLALVDDIFYLSNVEENDVKSKIVQYWIEVLLKQRSMSNINLNSNELLSMIQENDIEIEQEEIYDLAAQTIHVYDELSNQINQIVQTLALRKEIETNVTQTTNTHTTSQNNHDLSQEPSESPVSRAETRQHAESVLPETSRSVEREIQPSTQRSESESDSTVWGGESEELPNDQRVDGEGNSQQSNHADVKKTTPTLFDLLDEEESSETQSNQDQQDEQIETLPEEELTQEDDSVLDSEVEDEEDLDEDDDLDEQLQNELELLNYYGSVIEELPTESLKGDELLESLYETPVSMVLMSHDTHETYYIVSYNPETMEGYGLISSYNLGLGTIPLYDLMFEEVAYLPWSEPILFKDIYDTFMKDHIDNDLLEELFEVSIANYHRDEIETVDYEMSISNEESFENEPQTEYSEEQDLKEPQPEPSKPMTLKEIQQEVEKNNEIIYRGEESVIAMISTNNTQTSFTLGLFVPSSRNLVNVTVDSVESFYENFEFKETQSEQEHLKIEKNVGNSSQNVTKPIKQTESVRYDESSELVEYEEELETESEEIIEDKSHLLNFHYPENYVSLNLSSSRSTSEQFDKNIQIIKLLNKLDLEERLATVDEQHILAEYQGWGGLSEIFNYDRYTNQIKEIVSHEEYTQIRASVLNAYYTPQIMIDYMFDVLKQMGLKQAKVLETSAGIGYFIGNAPTDLNLDWTAIEIDSVSSRIAKHLYQREEIVHTPFEKYKAENDTFDLVISNVPFGSETIFDENYKLNYLIHDYFFVKGLDLVKPNGVVAFVTSNGTLDKASKFMRQQIAQKADLLGAVRIPSEVFKYQANANVVTDIIFLQKKLEINHDMTEYPSWVNAVEYDYYNSSKNKLYVNNYFVENKDMVVGNFTIGSSRHGERLDVSMMRQYEETNSNYLMRVKAKMENTKQYIQGEFNPVTPVKKVITLKNNQKFDTDESTHNFSFKMEDSKLYWKENNILYPLVISKKNLEKYAAFVELKYAYKEVVRVQLESQDEQLLNEKQKELKNAYDKYVDLNGRVNGKPLPRLKIAHPDDYMPVNLTERDDIDYPLLTSLEIYDSEKNFVELADIFTKRTIGDVSVPEYLENTFDAYTFTKSLRGFVDLDYIGQLTTKSRDEILEDLHGEVFFNPQTDQYESKDEYLSGEILEKIEWLQTYIRENPELEEEYTHHLNQLDSVLPERLGAEDIITRVQSPWVSLNHIATFIREVFETSSYDLEIDYDEYTETYSIKGSDRYRTLISSVFGYSNTNTAYDLLEKALNQTPVNEYDKILDANGKEKRVVNSQRTLEAREKQSIITKAFQSWVYQDPNRTDEIVDSYNRMYNSFVPRQYDGTNMIFVGMNPNIELYDHQKNAISRTLLSGNTLLGHVVGAGKTFTMISSAMESKRLGLAKKSLFVVPNHLVAQTAQEFYRLYPNARLLVAEDSDLTPQKRIRFASKITSQNFDAIIINSSQFDLINVSDEEMLYQFDQQLAEIDDLLYGMKGRYDHYSNKQLLSTRKLEQKRKTLVNQLEKFQAKVEKRKDKVIDFEELGIDRMYIDEAHNYKNMAVATTISVSGVNNRQSEKAFSMNAKVQYLNKVTDHKGVIFATGTPVSNTVAEMYVMQRYLQPQTLKKKGLLNFNAWASAFGEIVTDLEVNPEGTGYQFKDRFSRYVNVPELLSIFNDVADIKLNDDLELNVPELFSETIVCQPDEYTKEIIDNLGDRAEKIRGKGIDPSEDNLLKIVNEGRKVAIDSRLLDPNAPFNENGKIPKSAQKISEIYTETENDRLTQLVFCDLGTPKSNEFNSYDELKRLLIENGVNQDDIAYIHDYESKKDKDILFDKVREGTIRILIGSTGKMGTGMNVQDKLIAVHHIDAPWRPADLEQRNGRIARQGNQNNEVKAFYYVTENTFDTYVYQTLETKQRFISQVMTNKASERSAEDIDDLTLTYKEIKACTTNNPIIKDKIEMEAIFSRLSLARKMDQQNKIKLTTTIKAYPSDKSDLEIEIANIQEDIEYVKSLRLDENKTSEDFKIEVEGNTYTDIKEGSESLLEALKKAKMFRFDDIAVYRGFNIAAKMVDNRTSFSVKLSRKSEILLNLAYDPRGNITRLDNALKDRLHDKLTNVSSRLEILNKSYQESMDNLNKPFDQEEEYIRVKNRLDEINSELGLENKGQEDDFTLDIDLLKTPEIDRRNVLDSWDTIKRTENIKLRIGQRVVDIVGFRALIMQHCEGVTNTYNLSENENIHELVYQGLQEEKDIELANELNEIDSNLLNQLYRTGVRLFDVELFKEMAKSKIRSNFNHEVDYAIALHGLQEHIFLDHHMTHFRWNALDIMKNIVRSDISEDTLNRLINRLDHLHYRGLHEINRYLANTEEIKYPQVIEFLCKGFTPEQIDYTLEITNAQQNNVKL